MSWHDAVLAFWFGLDEERHWKVDPQIDAAISARFGALWAEQRGQPPDDFLGSAEQALAAILLFDQFPRNMFRDDIRAFATDPLARQVAAAAIDRGLDREVEAKSRHFFYLPFEHSEAIADQDRAIALFEALGNDRYLDFARKHRDVIVRFGRFPHRNALVGRQSTADEEAFGLEADW